MKIYTKKGDTGETGLFGNIRVPKDSLRIKTYGTVDELNAVLGLVLCLPGAPGEILSPLRRIQSELFQLGAELATPAGKSVPSALLGELEITRMEAEIDRMESRLSPLKTFILPGGGVLSAWIHLARTVSRRAERELTPLSRSESIRAEVLQYMNRLSDYFFVLARFANLLQGQADTPWIAPTPA